MLLDGQNVIDGVGQIRAQGMDVCGIKHFTGWRADGTENKDCALKIGEWMLLLEKLVVVLMLGRLRLRGLLKRCLETLAEMTGCIGWQGETYGCCSFSFALDFLSLQYSRYRRNVCCLPRQCLWPSIPKVKHFIPASIKELPPIAGTLKIYKVCY